MKTETAVNHKLTESISHIQFTDLFDLQEIQLLQDQVSDAMGVASLITHPDGTPITRQSNFCRLCSEIIRKTEKGLSNCYKSNMVIGMGNHQGPEIQHCLSGGLWNAGASITVGGKHVASWLIGQVRNEELDEVRILHYADEIGADRDEFIVALKEVPVMPLPQFQKLSKMLFAFANELSDKAYTNLLLKIQAAEREKDRQKLMERENLLTLSTQRLELMLQSAGAGTWDWDMASGELKWSDELFQLFGLNPADAEANFDAWTKAVHPGDREFASSLIEIAIRDKIPLQSEYRVVHPNGDVRWINALGNTTYDQSGKALRMLGICTDITDRKQSELALNVSERRYRELLDTLEAGIVVHAPDTSIITSNPKASEILGLSKDQMKGKLSIDPRWQFLLEDSTPLSLDLYPVMQLLNSKMPLRNMVIGVSRPETNDVVWVIVNGFPVFNIEGEISEVLISFIEITKRKHAEQELHRLNNTLEQRVAERTGQLERTNKELEFHLNEIEQFSYITTHDLQEPLRTLNTFAGLIRDGYSGLLDEDGNKYIDFIFKSANRMSELVRGLFEYSLLGKESSKTAIDCNVIAGIVMDDLADTIEKNNVEILRKELPVITGYGKEMRLLFQNLLENAIKFHNKEVHPVVRISAELVERNWVFSFEDNGIGIDRKDRDKIFIIFRRMHNREDYKGTGIGLAHCKKIVELHGGKIWVESEPDSGSKFMFTIPADLN
jgi:PAS domain S-box-containing protein